MENIDEIIADAMAEEEVKREQEKTKAKKKAADNFKKELKESLVNMVAELAPQAEQTVKISLSEYIGLVYTLRDLELLKAVLFNNMELSYNKEYVKLTNDGEIINVLKLLYPTEYNEAYKKLFNNTDTDEA